jgi:hypothetical protein
MELSVLIQLAVGLLVLIIGGIFMFYFKRFINRWDATEKEAARERKLHHVKTECIVEGLKEMNGNTSLKFGKTYDEKLNLRLKELNFTDK